MFIETHMHVLITYPNSTTNLQDDELRSGQHAKNKFYTCLIIKVNTP